MCQFIHSRFQCKLPLCRTIAPECSRRHHVRVNTAVFESMGSRLIVQRDCFMTGQTNGRCTMFAVSTLVRQCIQLNHMDIALFICADTDFDAHLMTAVGTGKCLFSGIDHLRCLASLQSHNRRVIFGNNGLFSSKTTADSRLHNTDSGLWNLKCSGKGSSDMERHLR